MAMFSISGRMSVKTVKKNFNDAFGGNLHIMKDGKPADEGATMASLRAEGCKGGELELKGNTKVSGMKKKMAELYGITVEVFDAEDKKAVDDGLTLASTAMPQVAAPAEKPAEKKEPHAKPAKEPKEKSASKAAPAPVPAQPTAVGFSFNELLDAALADGELTDKERAILLKKANAQGYDPDEVNLMIDGKLAKMKRKQQLQDQIQQRTAPQPQTMHELRKALVPQENNNILPKKKEFVSEKMTEEERARLWIENPKLAAKLAAKDNPILTGTTITGGTSSSKTDDKDTLLEKAQKCVKIGEYNEAISIYKRILTEYDTDCDSAYKGLFELYEKKGEYKEALKFGTRYADLNWNNASEIKHVRDLILKMFEEFVASNRKKDAGRFLDNYGKYLDRYGRLCINALGEDFKNADIKDTELRIKEVEVLDCSSGEAYIASRNSPEYKKIKEEREKIKETFKEEYNKERLYRSTMTRSLRKELS